MGKEKEDDIKYKGYDDRFSTYMWNSETGEFFGRTGVAWAKLTIFYLIFYCGLASFAGLCYYLFSRTLTHEHPKWILAESLIGTNPGMGYRPMPDPDNNAESTLIWYDRANQQDYSFWSKQLEKYMDAVDDSVANRDAVDCTYHNDKTATKHKSCRVDTTEFQSCSKANNFGYSLGEPCILLKLNRIYGWEPKGFGLDEDGLYDANLLREELEKKVKEGMPQELSEYIQSELKSKHSGHEEKFLRTVFISCEGEGVVDKENIGHISYYPQRGIPGFFYPYFQQNGYQSPFIFVQLKNPRHNTLINVECKAWARNIIHDRINRLGSVHFELMID